MFRDIYGGGGFWIFFVVYRLICFFVMGFYKFSFSISFK